MQSLDQSDEKPNQEEDLISFEPQEEPKKDQDLISFEPQKEPNQEQDLISFEPQEVQTVENTHVHSNVSCYFFLMIENLSHLYFIFMILLF